MRKRTVLPVAVLAAIIGVSACGTILPDKFVYRTDMPDPMKEKKAEKAAPVAQKEQPAEERQAASSLPGEVPAEEGGEVLFGAAPAPAPKPAEERSAPVPAREQTVQAEPAPQQAPAEKFVIPRPLPGQQAIPAEPVDARPSTVAPNAISHVFQTDFENTWNKTLAAMLVLPLASTDKASGLIITEWVMDDPSAGSGAGAGFFGGGGTGRVIKFKYTVVVSDKYGDTEVAVIPYAQYIDGGRWAQGTPKPVVAETLMKRIITKLEK